MSQSTSPTLQVWQPDRYRTQTAFVEQGGLPVIELLAPRAGERVLDLGCGTGALTRVLADSGASVVGVDSSDEMVRAARAAYPDLDFRVGDGEALAFDEEFDALFSNAALHWMTRARETAVGMFRALRPGGRMAVELGGHGNVQGVRAALDAAVRDLGVTDFPRPFAPWYFPKLGEHTAMLESVGFTVRGAWCFKRPSPMPDTAEQAGIAAWLEIFAGRWLAPLDADVRTRLLARVAELARPRSFRDGTWWIDYVRLRVDAFKPA